MASLGETLLGSEGKQGATHEDIGRARALFQQYMDWASRGLFDLAGKSSDTRRRGAKSLFELEDRGLPMQRDALNAGYNNAQDRTAQMVMGMRNARLGLPEDLSYLSNRGVNADLRPITNLPLPSLPFSKAPQRPQPLADPDIMSWGMNSN